MFRSNFQAIFLLLALTVLLNLWSYARLLPKSVFSYETSSVLNFLLNYTSFKSVFRKAASCSFKGKILRCLLVLFRFANETIVKGVQFIEWLPFQQLNKCIQLIKLSSPFISPSILQSLINLRLLILF